MWLTQPVARLPHAGFLQLHVVLDNVKFIFTFSFTLFVASRYHSPSFFRGGFADAKQRRQSEQFVVV